MLSTRSVGMNLARSFKAGRETTTRWAVSHSDALKLRSRIQSSLCDEDRHDPIPALKRRAKLITTLRVENTHSNRCLSDMLIGRMLTARE
jgi:hypothetical protein